MIKVLSGNWRGLGRREKALGAIISWEFREHLYKFKNAKLGVFLDLVLHSDEDGFCFPSYERIHVETGYSSEAISNALKDLCKLKINDQHILLKWRERDENHKMTGSNRYIVFPTEAEIKAETTGDPLPPIEEPTLEEPHFDFRSSTEPHFDLQNVGKPKHKINTLRDTNNNDMDTENRRGPASPEEAAWMMIRSQLKFQMNNGVNYRTFVDPLQFVGMQFNKFVLLCPTRDIQAWVDSHLSSTINRFLPQFLGDGAEVEFVLGDTI